MGKNRELLRTWVKEETQDYPLTQEDEERVLDIAEVAFHGRTGIGEAVKMSIEEVERETNKKSVQN
jgi:hypothetical protein